MNALAEARYEMALWRVDRAIEVLDGSLEQITLANLRAARGELVAMRQLLDMEEDLREAKTAPAPALRVVK